LRVDRRHVALDRRKIARDRAQIDLGFRLERVDIAGDVQV